MPLKFPYDVFIQDKRNIPVDKQTKGFPKTLFDMVNEGDIVEENDKPIQWNVAQKSNGYMLLVNPKDQLKSKGVTKSDFNQNYHVALDNITNTGEDVSWQNKKVLDGTVDSNLVSAGKEEPVKIPKGAPVEDKNLNKPQLEGMAKKVTAGFGSAIIERMDYILKNIGAASSDPSQTYWDGAKTFYTHLKKWIETQNL